MTLEECKDATAQQLADKNWDELMNYEYEYGIGLSKAYSKVDLMDSVAKLYAIEKVKEEWEVAAERTNYQYRDELGFMCSVSAIVLNLETEIVNNINKEG